MTEKISLRIDSQLLDRAKKGAGERSQTLSEYIKHSIRIKLWREGWQ